MLDIEVIDGPEDEGVDVVSVIDMKRHLRLSLTNDVHDREIEDAIEEAVGDLDGRDGLLNRTILPCTWRLYRRAFPTGSKIELPYPPLQDVEAIEYMAEDSGSPAYRVMDAADYIVLTGTVNGMIELRDGASWPTIVTHPRAVAITFNAGYSAYPRSLMRLVKILAANNMDQKSATLNDKVTVMVNRKVEFGVSYHINKLRVPSAMTDEDPE